MFYIKPAKFVKICLVLLLINSYNRYIEKLFFVCKKTFLNE